MSPFLRLEVTVTVVVPLCSLLQVFPGPGGIYTNVLLNRRWEWTREQAALAQFDGPRSLVTRENNVAEGSQRHPETRFLWDTMATKKSSCDLSSAA